MTIEHIKTRINVTKDAIRRFEAAFSAHRAQKRPDNVPEWAWNIELAGITSILADLHDELFILEREAFHAGLVALEPDRSTDSDPQRNPPADGGSN
jgi:hypothetical protein